MRSPIDEGRCKLRTRIAAIAARGAGIGARQDHREFVAAEADHDRIGGHRLGDPSGEGGEGPVAGLVAERVVDGLEIVEIDEQQPDRPRLDAGVGERFVQPRLERAAVGQPGHRVVGRRPGDPVPARSFPR